jgi:hypothetical protein
MATDEALPGVSFHDAEIVVLHLDRDGPTLDLEMECVYPPSDAGTVCLRFERVTELELSGFNNQNVLFDLEATQAADGMWDVRLSPSYGVEAVFRCSSVHRAP